MKMTNTLQVCSLTLQSACEKTEFYLLNFSLAVFCLETKLGRFYFYDNFTKCRPSK